MRICLVYDCLFPYTVGGAERWYRNLAERLAAEGHEVAFLTRRQWHRGAQVDLPGVRVVALEPRVGCTRPTGAAGSTRRWSSALAAWRTSRSGAGATTSCTRPQFPTSRCWLQ